MSRFKPLRGDTHMTSTLMGTGGVRQKWDVIGQVGGGRKGAGGRLESVLDIQYYRKLDLRHNQTSFWPKH